MKGVLAGLLLVLASTSQLAAQQAEEVLLNGRILPGSGYGVGIDDAAQQRNWLFEADGSLRMDYPGNLGWAALFITVGGPVVPHPRPGRDMSAYSRLVVEMKGEDGGECVAIGIKDSDDPDDGTEPKQQVQLSAAWRTHEFPLPLFGRRSSGRSPLDPKSLYVLTEFVFPCSGTQDQAQRLYVRTIKFLE